MSQVVIQDITPRTQIVATEGQTVFNTLWTADAIPDVLVYARASGVPADDATQFVPSVGNYYLEFVGVSQTVRITFVSPRIAGDIITIVRDTPATRTNLYINTNFTPSMLNQDFGILTLVDQQDGMYDTVVNPGYNVSAIIDQKDKVLPTLIENQVWAMNPTNTAIIAYNVPASGGVAPANATYILQTPNGYLANAQSLSALASGIMISTNATGVILSRVMAGTANQLGITNPTGITGNPTYFIVDNARLPGVEGIGIPIGTTGQRPVTPVGTSLRLNSTLVSFEFWDGSAWVQLQDSNDLALLIARLAAHTPGDGASMIGLENQGTVSGKTVQDMSEVDFVTLTDSTGTLVNGIVLGDVALLLAGGTMAGNINMGSNAITSLLDPTNPQDAATKYYVDTEINTIAGGSDTQMQYNNGGALGGDSGFTTDGAGTLSIAGQLTVDNLNFNGNEIISNDANGNINFIPNGTGINFFGKDIYVENSINSSIILWSPDLLRTSYSLLEDFNANGFDITKVTAAGASTISLTPKPQDGISNAVFQIFRTTNTSGSANLQIHLGDNTTTVNHVLSGKGSNSLLCANNGNLTIGSGSTVVTVNGELQVDNTNINGNTVTSTNTNGNINFTPNGTGINFFNKNIQLQTSSDPTIRIWSEDLLQTSFSDFSDVSAGQLNINKTTASSGCSIRLNAMPLDGTSGAEFGVFRTTNTSGTVSFTIYKGNNTATGNHSLLGAGNSRLCIDNGNLTIGNGSTTTLTLNASTPVSSILNDGTMAANSATALATQQSIKTYVDARASNRVSIAGTTQTAAVNTTYIALNAAQTTMTLPSVFAVGETIALIGSTANTGGWVVATATGDTIRANNITTSAGGTVSSAALAGQTIYLMADIANTSWVMTGTVSTTLTTS